MNNASEFILFLPIGMAIIMYILAVIVSNRNFKQWPSYRTVCWISGILSVAFVMIGPIADRAHVNFGVHMVGHILLGMLSPLLIALSAPITLLLRTLEVKQARRFSRILSCWPIQVLSDPTVAALLNMGGLWILYTTDLFMAVHPNILLYIFIHLHVFLAGYLFTIAMIDIDPKPHKANFLYRAIVLVVSMASHGILSKYIYAYPPTNIPPAQAEIGGMLMYYGGDVIDSMIIFILCLQWYKTQRPRMIVKETIPS